MCPWNSPKFVQLTREPDFTPRSRVVNRRLVDLMRLDEAAWDELTRGSPIRRAGHAGLRRNVAVALGNWLATQDEPDADAVAALEEALSDPEPLVRAHAAWALGRVGSPGANAALMDSLADEEDAVVREEVLRALEPEPPHCTRRGEPGVDARRASALFTFRRFFPATGCTTISRSSSQ